MSTPQKAIEDHPIFHDWYRQTDVVTAKNNRGRVIEVKREEQCRFCPTLRITNIDTNVWERAGHPRYKYVKDVAIIRMAKPAYLRQRFLATTDLPDEIKAKL
jgi:hypothetical protein